MESAAGVQCSWALVTGCQVTVVPLRSLRLWRK